MVLAAQPSARHLPILIFVICVHSMEPKNKTLAHSCPFNTLFARYGSDPVALHWQGAEGAPHCPRVPHTALGCPTLP